MDSRSSGRYSVTYNLVVTPPQILSFNQPSPPPITAGNGLTNPATSTLSGGSYGAISYSSSNTAVATVNASGTVTTLSGGTVTITATQAAVTGINAQVINTYSLTVNPVPVPVLNFNQAGPLAITIGNSLTNTVTSTLTGGSYGAISYSSSDSAIATVNASGTVTTLNAGTVTITATQAAVTGINAQVIKTYSLTVNPVPVPVLNFNQPGPLAITVGNSLTNTVTSTLTGGSYGTISYSSSDPTIATVNASGAVTTLNTGTVTITATQAAVTRVNGLSTKTYSLSVIDVPVLRFSQAGPLQVTLGNSLTNIATSTLSGGNYGAISYSSSNPAIATVNSSGTVTTLNAGAVTITATQTAVNGVNEQAIQTYALTVTALPLPVLSFSQAGPLQITIGNSLTNVATSTLSGGNFGAISYSSSNPAIASVDGAGKVSALVSGSVTITATQAAVKGINAQTLATYSLSVGKNAQTALVLNADKRAIYTSTGKAIITASGGSGSGAVSFAITSGACSLSGNILSAGSTAGTCVVTATKDSESNFNPATASISIEIQNLTASAVTIGTSQSQVLDGVAVTLTAAVSPATSTGSVIFMDGQVNLGSVPLANGSAALMTKNLSVGAHLITALYSGDAITASANSTVLNVVVGKRPDPVSNAVVKATAVAAANISQRFTETQITNVYSHVQILHSDFSIKNRFGVALNAPGLDMFRMAVNKISDNLTASKDTFGNDSYRLSPKDSQEYTMAKAPFAKGEAFHADGGSNEEEPAKNNELLQIAGKPIGIWTAGNIDVGGIDAQNGNRTKFSSSGLTIGLDMMWNPKLIIGASIGYARDTATMDTLGSESKSRQWSGMLYGTYKPEKQWFVDGVVGMGKLNFDNRRWDDVNNQLLAGERSGQVSFASTALTRDIAMGNDLHIQPFGRLDVLHARLDAYNERGSVLALSLNNARSTTTALTGGLTIAKDLYYEFGQVSPSLKLQLRHRTSGDMDQSMYYTDLGAGSTNYSVVVVGLPEDIQSVGLGLNVRSRRGLTTNFSWLGSMGANTYRANSFRVDFRLGF
ncbi:autotransporter domain-containing protein [Undibacterium sp. CY21W]|uniref:autotransporter domain-containing protein n=1 Tax=Undibacterium sp. CY21W TaxID=2762293 RepID=UPI00164AC58D|nr:autotransporter domain-containing protein [Undibacterium sp. CY21W]MBC3927355.1 autotransporter domain-containing protein [Undibacterium sp. CY21W]